MDAVILGFLAGPLAGNAIADFLTGRVSPSARLPMTYPKHQDLSGVPYLHEISDMCTRDTGGTLPHWDNIPCEVEWPFGHGLSYAQFTYSNIRLSTNTLRQRWHHDKDGKTDKNTELVVTVTVTNTGDIGGAEIVLFFSFDKFRSTTPEYKRLRGYEKVWLEPGESKDVSISISLQDDLRFVGPHDDTHYILEDGLEFRIGIGSNSDCRNDPGGDYNLCSDVVTIRTEDDYIGACETACNLWKDSGGSCANNAFSPKSSSLEDAMGSCRKSCADDESNGGWGWNYVQCLESVFWSEQFDSETDCWKLTSLCRDVTRTMDMDEFGKPNNRSQDGANLDAPPSAIMVAMLAGAVASVMIVHAIRAGFSTTVYPSIQSTTRGKNYGDVEFSAIRSCDETIAGVC